VSIFKPWHEITTFCTQRGILTYTVNMCNGNDSVIQGILNVFDTLSPE